MPDILYKKSPRARHIRITVRPDSTVTVTLPGHVTLSQAQEFVQSRRQWIQKHLDNYARKLAASNRPDLSPGELSRAQHELFDRLVQFAQLHQLPVGKVTFRRQKTLWGSCTGRNNINLNVSLVYLPRHLQDYVLLHELTHLRHRHHGPRFWAQLDLFTGNQARLLDRELGRQVIRI